MTTTEYQSFAKDFFDTCLSISQKKGADYTGDGSDAFANFRQIPEGWTEIGFLTRMGDKMARLRSFVQKGFLEVADESVTDSLQDLANFCCMFAGYLKDKNGGEIKQAMKLSLEQAMPATHSLLKELDNGVCYKEGEPYVFKV